MLTKAIIQNIDYTKNICRVRIPLFENASRNVNIIEADAQFSVVPGIYNSYKTGDIVFIGFEENRMELPIILGKLFVSTSAEASTPIGNLSGNSLSITETAQLPYSTIFNFDKITKNDQLYKNLNTPKKLADSIIDLQRSQDQPKKYQTVIKVLATKLNKDIQESKFEYELYLKTSNDFSYSLNSSDEALNRLCTALKRSQIYTDQSSIFIPLDLAVAKDGTISQALMQVQEITVTELQFKVFIGEECYLIKKSDIVEVHSTAIYY